MADDKSGPDLGAGIDLSELADGGIVSGSYRGTPVIVANDGGRFCALHAECTHMGAPLGEGLLANGTVRCPWHHARFSVHTGEAVGAPAFAPLTRFGTSVRDGRLFVTELPSAARAAAGKALEGTSAALGKSPGRVVIIGGGAGGHACADMLARSGFGDAVTIVSDDAHEPYDRTTCSKQYLTGSSSREDCRLAQPGFYHRPGADAGPVLYTNRRVQSIDVRRKSVSMDGGERLPFDVLVLATGAEPKRPKTPGFDRANVHVLRTLDDADALIHAAKDARRVAIVGASFIGLEAAASLKQRKLDVHVVAPDAIPLEGLLGADVGAMVRRVHEEKGVQFHLGRQVTSFDGSSLTLDDDSIVDTDFVVVGMGVTPRTALAEAADLVCAPMSEGGGVMVDDRLETSAPGIFAIGDIASYPDLHIAARIRVEHWVHAQRQGQHVARVLMGTADRFTDLPFFWSAHFDTGFRYLGHVHSIAHCETDGSVDGRNFERTCDGKREEHAFITCNRDMAALTTEAEWEKFPAAGT